MSKIERRHTTVTLYGGQTERELRVLLDKVADAVEREKTQQRRMSTKLESTTLAAEYDERVEAARSEGVEVPVWALSYLHWGPLADEHPPRDGEKVDSAHGLNMKTFPRPLMLGCLVDPSVANGLSIEELIAAGQRVLDDLGDLDIVHVRKLEKAAWDVTVGDDALPKSSLVSLLQEQSERDSKRPSDSE